MIKKLASNKIFAICGALFCCALWGVSTPVVKMGYAYIDESHIPSLLLWVGLQFVVGGFLTIGTYSLVSQKFLLPKKENLKGVAIVSLLQTVLQYSLMYIGLSLTTSVKGAILKSTDVFFVALIGVALGGKFDFVGMLPVFVCLSLIYAVSYVLWTILLKYNPASGITIYSFMTPVFGVIFSALLLTEDGGVAISSLIVALILVCFGIILWSYEKPGKA